MQDFGLRLQASGLRVWFSVLGYGQGRARLFLRKLEANGIVDLGFRVQGSASRLGVLRSLISDEGRARAFGRKIEIRRWNLPRNENNSKNKFTLKLRPESGLESLV